MNREELLGWCGEVAAGFRGHEHPDQDPYRCDRDTALVAYAVTELGRRRDYATAEVAEYVDRLQTGMEDAA